MRKKNSACLAAIIGLLAASGCKSESPARHDAGAIFRDCSGCPEMVVVAGGDFIMGVGRNLPYHAPRHRVSVPPFAVGRYEVTFAEWDLCVAEGACRHRPADAGFGRGEQPVINVSWNDAQQYVRWLYRRTKQPYRLLSEAEWEFVARAGQPAEYPPWNPSICNGCESPGDSRGRPLPGAVIPANDFGVHNLVGNVWEWVEDCWNKSYAGAPDDGSAWLSGDCGQRVRRGGSWLGDSYTNVFDRIHNDPDFRNSSGGFRVAKDL